MLTEEQKMRNVVSGLLSRGPGQQYSAVSVSKDHSSTEPDCCKGGMGGWSIAPPDSSCSAYHCYQVLHHQLQVPPILGAIPIFLFSSIEMTRSTPRTWKLGIKENPFGSLYLSI